MEELCGERQRQRHGMHPALATVSLWSREKADGLRQKEKLGGPGANTQTARKPYPQVKPALSILFKFI